MEQVSSLLTQKLEAMVEAADGILLDSKREAISTLFIYVILEQGRQKRMANAISHALQVSGMWIFIKPYTSMLFCGPSTPSMNSLIILLSPYIGWDDRYHSKCDVISWATAASAVPYTEEVGRDVVSALLQILIYDSLRPHIPPNIWTWLKKHSTLAPLYQPRHLQVTSSTVRYIRGLEDIEILNSFFILTWLEYNAIDCEDMMDLFKEDFCGIGMWGHRKDLLERLDGCSQSGRHSFRYKILRDRLLEVETEAANTLIRTLSELSFFYKYVDSSKRGCTQNHTPTSPVLCPSPAHDLSLHIVNVWLQRPVLLLPPHPFRSRHISLPSNCCVVVFGSGEGNYHTFRDSSDNKQFFPFRL